MSTVQLYLYLRGLTCIMCLLAAFALPGWLSLASELDERQGIPVLQLRSYDSGWLRFYNLDSDGERRLENDSGESLPFRRVISEFPLGRDKLEDANIVAWLISHHALAYDVDRIDGHCDTEKLLEKNEDVVCVPGSAELPIGYIFLVLYDPETGQIAALTTSVDNSIGWANPAQVQEADTQEARAQGTDTQEGQSQEGQVQLNPESTAEGCGPYMAGQWITAEDYAASGLDLSINRDDVGNPITDYACVQPEDGGSAYLQAYSFIDAVEVRDRSDSDDDEEDEEIIEPVAQPTVVDC